MQKSYMGYSFSKEPLGSRTISTCTFPSLFSNPKTGVFPVAPRPLFPRIRLVQLKMAFLPSLFAREKEDSFAN